MTFCFGSLFIKRILAKFLFPKLKNDNKPFYSRIIEPGYFDTVELGETTQYGFVLE